ncbi:hypothetical protein X777_01878 [Ooceraea biroi]|uniref:Uncharacterized protein n=1 Tax=Ooceraea biroi TaxID=2015173 RepID=A0A026WQ72_OOCBI|nr:hypothetical protein X777_01878 [Ooceraea biroi]
MLEILTAGRTLKKSFKILKIKDLVIAIVKAIEPNAAIYDVEKSIKDWLKLAPLRVTLADSRALKTNSRKDN